VSGFPAYITGGPASTSTSIQRRRSYLPHGCDYNPATSVPACNDALLPPFVVHPLNYNHMNGEELRLLNPNYPGGEFDVPAELVQCGVGDPSESAECAVEVVANSSAGPVVSPANDPNRWMWVYATETITPGCAIPEVDCRVAETAVDFNSPFAADTPACIVSTEATPAEGAIICGADPGEPGYAGFSVFSATGYSTPAIRNVASPSTPISGLGTGDHRLFDPTGCAERNAVSPGSCASGGFLNWLLKPTVRPRPFGTTAQVQPNYLLNSVANLTANGEDSLVPSNENDYFAGNTLAQKRVALDAAAALGKALFWDMQVGSDGVQACASCHFVAGVDDRTKNQVNPNHIGIPQDLTFQVAQPNEDLVATDFPFSTGGDTAAHNDVASSMGVHFGKFQDIPTIGAWVINASGVRVLPMDLRSPNAADNLDSIPGFAGTTGNEFRRVEPRNTPTLLAAALNFDNFWDGRARHDFNGGSVFGASDPQAHVFVDQGSGLTATRQIIRNVSLASLATGPALSDFEMSFAGRNWAKIGKKLLQGTTTVTLADNVTPLANQLVSTSDSVLGFYSNQGGSACGSVPTVERSGSWASTGTPGKPGLCISYAGLIRRAFYPQLWANTASHLNGAPDPGDPFDGYSLTIAGGAPVATDTNQFTQMEANFSLFFGLSVHAWGTILLPDDTPFDVFMEANPDSFKSLGEPNEPGLVWDMPSCSQNGGVQPCFTESGPFKRDPGLPLNLETGPGVTVGTRQPGDPDPLLGFDIFYGFNLSGKNPEFRTTRCGECHAAGTTTDHTVETSNQLSFGDFVAEFSTPGVELPIEPLGRSRQITGFSLEGEINGNAQDGVERRIANQSVFNPADGLTYPDGSSFFDNGMYNLGVTPCQANYAGEVTGQCDDISRGGDDPFGWPLSLAALMMKNLAGEAFEPGVPMDTFDPEADPECAPGCVTGGLFEETAQDQEINPGFEDEPANPLLPPYLAPWVSNITVGDEAEQDEAGGGGGGMVNTLTEPPLLEGYVDTIGPFNPAGIIGEIYNMAPPIPMGTWPVVNRAGRAGSFKAPQLRIVELTGPYFHNGGKLTLAQVVDFYTRGGDFSETNAVHRDFNIMDLLQDGQALGGLTPAEQNARLVALVDFLLTLTDERVRNEQAPFDHPEIFVPLDGRSPENTFGRPGFVAGTTGDCLGVAGAGPCFRQIPAVGAAGLAPLGLPPADSFLGVTNDRGTNGLTGFNCDASNGPISQYCIAITP
jgi:cytochrome c peroxidase